MKSQPTYPAPAPMTAAMRDVIDRMARAGRPPLHSLTPDEARAAYEKGANVLEVPLRALHQVQDLSLIHI